MSGGNLEETILEQRRLLEEKDALISSLCSALADAYASRYPHLSDSESDQEDIFRPPKRFVVPMASMGEYRKRTIIPTRVAKVPDVERGAHDDHHNDHSIDSILETHSGDHDSEDAQRDKNCMLACGECWKEIEEEEQRVIFKEAKKEKKEIASYSHALANEMLNYNVSIM